MGILFSELFLLFEVSLLWVEVEDGGLLLIVLSVEAIGDVLFISLQKVPLEYFLLLEQKTYLMKVLILTV